MYIVYLYNQSQYFQNQLSRSEEKYRQTKNNNRVVVKVFSFMLSSVVFSANYDIMYYLCVSLKIMGTCDLICCKKFDFYDQRR